MNASRNKHRAGRYVRQTGDYQAFIPATLPPYPPVEMDQELWALLSQADRDVTRLPRVGVEQMGC